VAAGASATRAARNTRRGSRARLSESSGPWLWRSPGADRAVGGLGIARATHMRRGASTSSSRAQAPSAGDDPSHDATLRQRRSADKRPLRTGRRRNDRSRSSTAAPAGFVRLLLSAGVRSVSRARAGLPFQARTLARFVWSRRARGTDIDRRRVRVHLEFRRRQVRSDSPTAHFVWISGTRGPGPRGRPEPRGVDERDCPHVEARSPIMPEFLRGDSWNTAERLQPTRSAMLADPGNIIQSFPAGPLLVPVHCGEEDNGQPDRSLPQRRATPGFRQSKG
jgi:hypothetical protein